MQTASWYTKLPDTSQVIGISRGTPRGMAKGYRQYKALAPGPWFKTATTEEYIELYFTEILGRLDPVKVEADLMTMAGGKTPTLVCYEKPGGADWCHRGMVSLWLHQHLGIEVTEYGHPGFGEQHVMLPPSLRRP
ncbi:hypothetical protein A6A04_19460 [Paramagnetospirillum marisnigri]|uniref:DUF488 domain-containing protein n=1 Tax=Paramagnetospirillum marisnigri TaxID=1285242 RepID=A0A178ML62_9PROT|nr:hypothetical protein [Paramagnetospirillum marisnigri]OAN49406.1 hypothetical protein A6A04_19460 [Paramagnetospirillum marisnigri]